MKRKIYPPMNERFVVFKDSDGHLVSIRVKDIRNVTFAYDNYYLVMYDTPHKKRKWDTILVTEEEAEHLTTNLMVFAWTSK
jgi:hypothetical protein